MDGVVLQQVGQPHFGVADVGAEAHVGRNGDAGGLPVFRQGRPVCEVGPGHALEAQEEQEFENGGHVEVRPLRRSASE